MACFPAASFGGGVGYIVALTKYSRRSQDCLIGDIIGIYSSVGNVRNGSVADLFDHSTGRSASGGIAAVKSARYRDFERLESATKGHSTISGSDAGRRLYAINYCVIPN